MDPLKRNFRIVNPITSKWEFKKLEEIVEDCIKDKRALIFTYLGDLQNPRGRRFVYPMAFGESRRGNLVVRAWQVRGESKSKNEPKWRLFRLDKILSPHISKKGFKVPKKGYNFKGDRSMRKMFINAKFDKRHQLNEKTETKFQRDWRQGRTPLKPLLHQQ